MPKPAGVFFRRAFVLIAFYGAGALTISLLRGEYRPFGIIAGCLVGLVACLVSEIWWDRL